MIDPDDKEMIIRTMAELLHEQLTEPLCGFLDSLFFNLLACGSIDPELLDKQLSSLIAGLEEYQVGSQGHRLLRRYQLLAQKGVDGSILDILSSAERTAASKPDWFRGLIEGGLESLDPEP